LAGTVVARAEGAVSAVGGDARLGSTARTTPGPARSRYRRESALSG
jgi:hypothetical protein